MVDMEGWLEKSSAGHTSESLSLRAAFGNMSSPGDKRFFVLTENTLQYYKSEADCKAGPTKGLFDCRRAQFGRRRRRRRCVCFGGRRGQRRWRWCSGQRHRRRCSRRVRRGGTQQRGHDSWRGERGKSIEWRHAPARGDRGVQRRQPRTWRRPARGHRPSRRLRRRSSSRISQRAVARLRERRGGHRHCR